MVIGGCVCDDTRVRSRLTCMVAVAIVYRGWSGSGRCVRWCVVTCKVVVSRDPILVVEDSSLWRNFT